MAITVTPIPYAVPQPDGVGLDFHNTQNTAVDQVAGKLYQFLYDPALPITECWIVTLDVVTATETGRVAYNTTGPNGREIPYWSVSVSGTEWIVHSGYPADSNVLNFWTTWAVSAVTGTGTRLDNPVLGSEITGGSNEMFWSFAQPLGASHAVAWGLINHDYLPNGELTHAAIAALKLTLATGAIEFIAFADEGAPKTSLFGAVTNTLGETFAEFMIPGPTTATTATIYYAHGKWTDGATLLPEDERLGTKYIFSLTVDTSSVFSYTEIGSFTEDAQVTIHNARYEPSDASIIVNYIKAGGTYWLRKIDIATGNTLLLEQLADDIHQIVTPDRFDDPWRQFHTPAAGEFFMHSRASLATDSGKTIKAISATTLNERAWLPGADVAVEFPGAFSWAGSYMDHPRCSVYHPTAAGDGNWAIISFPCEGPAVEPEPEIDTFDLALVASIGTAFTLLATTRLPPICPTLGRGSDVCATGRTAVPPGLGQVVCGMEAVTADDC